MNVANNCSADDVSVRLCFFVNVRKARGRSVAGGISIGSIDGLDVSGGFEIRIGWTGVPKAGEEEGIKFGCAGVWCVRKTGAVRVCVA